MKCAVMAAYDSVAMDVHASHATAILPAFFSDSMTSVLVLRVGIALSIMKYEEAVYTSVDLMHAKLGKRCLHLFRFFALTRQPCSLYLQVYHSFSSPANSKVAREMFKEMQAELGARTETTSDPASNGTSGGQDTAGTADNSDVAHSGGEKIKPDEAESQSPGNTDASSQANGAGVMPPPLNPFMIPLKLLRRK